MISVSSANHEKREFKITNLLENPFEKFERKRFVYYSEKNKNEKEDTIVLNILAFNPKLYDKISVELKNELVNKLNLFLKDYYKNLGGL